MTTTEAVDIKKDNARIMGIPLVYFMILFIIIMGAIMTGKAPKNMLTGFVFALVFAAFLTWLGGLSRKFDMIGGPSLLCLFVPTILLYFGLLPQNTKELATAFYTDMGYIEFFLAALIAGSLLSMDRNLLIKAGLRYAIPIVIGLLGSWALTGIVGSITGYGFKEALRDIGIPIMAGGVGAGAIPISQIFAGYGGSQETILSSLLPATTLGNLWAILFAAILSMAGTKSDRFFKGFSGKGKMMRVEGGEQYAGSMEEKYTGAEFVSMGVGLLITGALYLLGRMINVYLVPSIHPYAWTILAAAVIKISGIMPEYMEKAAGDWYGLISVIGLPTMLVLTSFNVIDIPTILGAITNPAYLVITLVTVIGAVIFAGLGGYIVKMYFVESAITAGLCMANMGGSGDIAVLGAAKRMNLMPFAQISSRLGGALILLVTGFIAPLLMQ